MFGLKLNEAKSMFFDSRKVLSSTDKTKRRILSKFGAYVRRTARSSIRKRKKVSPPGKPPTNRTGFLKRFIYFGYDTAHQSVVIGPVRLNSKVGDAPQALELGGKSTVVSGLKKKRKKKTISIAARPFIRPAMEKELPKLPQMWRGSIK